MTDADADAQSRAYSTEARWTQGRDDEAREAKKPRTHSALSQHA